MRALLLKGEPAAEEDALDDFAAAMCALGVNAQRVPVMRSVPLNADESRRIAMQLSDSIVLLTSPKCVRYLAAATDGIEWPVGMTAYVVGPGTAAAVHKSFPGWATTGADAGSGSVLAVRIAADWQRGAIPRVWFPCAAQRRPELVAAMTREGIPFIETHLYDTVVIEEHAMAALSSLKKGDWAVLFSPSAASRLARHIPGEVRVAAIGESTATALRDAGRTPDAVAAHPTPHSLAEAIGFL